MRGEKTYKNMLREIKIDPVLNGWIVEVGCQRVVFTDKQVMLGELSQYLADPHAVVKRYLANAANQSQVPEAMLHESDLRELRGMSNAETKPAVQVRDA